MKFLWRVLFFLNDCCLWICWSIADPLVHWQLTKNCQIFGSNCDGDFLTVTQRLIFICSYLHWINTLNWRTCKLENVSFSFHMKTLLKWTDGNSELIFCDFISWIQALKKEKIWGDFRHKVLKLTFRFIVIFLQSLLQWNFLSSSTFQASYCRGHLWERHFL